MTFRTFVESPVHTLYNWKSKKLRYLSSDATIPTLTGRMNTFRIRTMPILDKGNFSGIVTQSDTARQLPPDIKLLPISVLTEKVFNFEQLSEGSAAFKLRTIGDVFSDILNIEQDTKIALIESNTPFLDAIKKFTEMGVNNRRYRTLVIRDSGQCVGVLSYLDVFNIMLDPKYSRIIEGFLDLEVGDFCVRRPTVHTEKDSLADAIFTFDCNPFTHLPITRQGDNDVIGLVDEITARSLQYDVIYELLDDMELGKILEIQRPIFRDITVSKTDKMKEALKKFTQSKMRPKTLLVGDILEDASVVSLDGVLSYVDVSRAFINFASQQFEQANGAEA